MDCTAPYLGRYMNFSKAQRGGTLIGIVAGLLVGLAIALAAAIYVTKVPVPFVQKVTPAAAPKPEEEAKKNATWDPNAPLYGKHPAGTQAPPADLPTSEANNQAANAPSATSATAPSDAVPPVVQPTTKPQVAIPPPLPPAKPPKPVKTPGATSTGDPIADIAKAATQAQPAAAPVASNAKPAAADVPADSAVDPWIYFLQAGAFRDQSQAESLRAKLALAGLDAKITEREQAGSAVYRVRMGPYNTLDEVTSSKARLDSQGIEGATVRVPR